jgi:ATP-dependent helicase/DNAse subunit B
LFREPAARLRARNVGVVREDDPMPILLVTGPANAGKARVVLDLVREHRARGERPLLVVPTRTDTERFAHELSVSGLLPGVRVERFDGLIAEVIRRAGDAPPALGALARERVLAHVSGRSTRGLTRALEAFVAELEVERIDAPQLRAALDAWGAADPPQRARATRLAELYEGYQRALAQLGRSDPEQRATQALDALRRRPGRWGAIPVLFYGFDDFTRLQLDVIETLGTIVAARVTVSLTFERGRDAFAGRARIFQTLAALATEQRELPPRTEHYAPSTRGALHHLERHIFEARRARARSAEDAVRLLEGGGERAELELVAEEIRGLLQRGVPAREIVLAHRSPGTIAELLEEIFAAHAIPYALQRRIRFADTALGGALLGALIAACETDAALEPLLKWLRAPGVLPEPELADELESRARRAGITTAAGALALCEAASWSAQSLAPLRELRDVAAGARAANGSREALLQCTAHELERLAAAAAVLEPLTPREEHALQVARRTLEDVRELIHVDFSLLVPQSPREDVATLIATLRSLEFVIPVHHPREATTALADAQREAVAVLDPLALRARRVRVLFLCGLQEGVFPAPARAEPLLSEEERRRLVESSGLLALAGGARGVETLLAERYLFYAAISRSEELLVLSWHTADDDGLARSRSLFVDDVSDLFSCDLHGARNRRALGELADGEGGEEAHAPRSRPREIAQLRDERVLTDLHERRLWSASALEAWAGCPARWFAERLLRARDLEPEPEPLARGALAHAALRDVLEGLRSETGSARLRPETLARAHRLLRAALAEREHEHPLSVAPERVPGVRRRLQVDLERYLEHAAAQASPLEPAHLELSFGFDEEDGLPALDLGDGIQVRGRIDRVDVDPNGDAAVVYDYKSSRAPEAGRWARERSFQVALYMRAAASLPATHIAGGFYQPLSGRDLRARGALEQDVAFELDCVRGDTREHDELQALVEEALAAAREAAKQARAGELQARPRTCGFGDRGCMYPTICRCER